MADDKEPVRRRPQKAVLTVWVETSYIDTLSKMAREDRTSVSKVASSLLGRTLGKKTLA
jgi:hypothetical protein